MTDEEREKKKLGSLANQFGTFGKRAQTQPDASVTPFADVLPQADVVPLPPTETDIEAETFTQTSVHNRRGRQAFERTHKRATYWVLKPLIVRLQKVSRKYEMSQTELIEEGIRYVLKKYEQP